MKKDKLKKTRLLWILWISILVIAAFVLPYVLYNDYYQIEGAFLFWVIFAIIALVSTIKITTYWSDDE